MRGDEVVATTWGFHFRLLRALADDRVTGSLSRGATEGVRALAAEPPAGALVVLDPRTATAVSATLAAKHGLNLLVADLLGAAKVHRARVLVTERNLGRGWSATFRAEKVRLDVV